MQYIFNLHSQLAFVNLYLTYAREPAFTEVELFYQSLSRRDWTYTYSDDRRAWLAGSKHLRELKETYAKLCGTGDLGRMEIDVTKPLLEEFVIDIPEETNKKIKEWSGKQVKLDSNTCYQLIQCELHPEMTLTIKRIDNALGALDLMVMNLGELDGRDQLIYSPHMIPARDLASTIYATDLGKAMYNHVAISRKAVQAIDKLFQDFTNAEIEAYLTFMPYNQSRASAVSVDMGDGTRKRFMQLGKAMIALNPNAVPFERQANDMMAQLYGRRVTEETIAKVEKYREQLIDLIERTGLE